MGGCDAVSKHRQLTKRKVSIASNKIVMKKFSFCEKTFIFMKENEKIFIDFHKIFIEFLQAS